MNTIPITTKLAALWTSLMFLYVYADIMSLFRPGEIDHIRGGMMGPLTANETTLLFGSIVMIIPALMIFLSVVLRPHISRWTNLIVGGLYLLMNIGNVIGESWVYYLLFCALEVALPILIIHYAWMWKPARPSE